MLARSLALLLTVATLALAQTDIPLQPLARSSHPKG